jgi:hypothetical protein
MARRHLHATHSQQTDSGGTRRSACRVGAIDPGTEVQGLETDGRQGNSRTRGRQYACRSNRTGSRSGTEGALVVLGRAGGMLRGSAVIKCREKSGTADLQRQRPRGRRHEACRYERAEAQGDQQYAGYPVVRDWTEEKSAHDPTGPLTVAPSVARASAHCSDIGPICRGGTIYRPLKRLIEHGAAEWTGFDRLRP